MQHQRTVSAHTAALRLSKVKEIVQAINASIAKAERYDVRLDSRTHRNSATFCCCITAAYNHQPRYSITTRSFDKDGVVPRFELYHAPFSICSNKVRLILAELGQVWLSHEMDITAPAQENYRPDYVCLRLASDIAQTATLSTEFSGGSSVAESGFDALVVPTLVDNLEMKIVADSKNICLYLSRQVQNPNLLPADLEYEILGQVNAVDATPHVALLYGANPDGDRRPPVFQRGTVGVHDEKIAALELARSDAPDLAHAYNAKIAKERSAEKFVDDPQSMRSAIDQVDAQIETLNKSLGKTEGSWLFGSSYTLADAMWALSLFRLEYLGYGQMWRVVSRIFRTLMS